MSDFLEVLPYKQDYRRLVTTQNGKSERILSKGPCPILETCGRCRLLNFSYQRQLLKKTEKAKAYFQKIGNSFSYVAIKDCIDAPEKLAYRHSVHLMVSERTVESTDHSKQKRRIDIGYYQPKLKQVVDIGRCPIQSLYLNHILAWMRTGIRMHNVTVHSRSNKEGILDSILLMANHNAKHIFICFVVSKMRSATLRPLACDIAAKFSNVRGIFMRTREDTENKDVKLLTGFWDIKDNFLGVTQEKSFYNFFAANPSMSEKIIKRILALQEQYSSQYEFCIATSNNFLPTVLQCQSLETALSSSADMICYVTSLSQSAEEILKSKEFSEYEPLFVEPFDMLPGTDYIEAIILFLKR